MVCRLDCEWATLWDRLFEGLAVSTTKLRRAVSRVPAAARGLRNEAEMMTFAETGEGKRALIDALAAYLEAEERLTPS